MKYWVVYSLSKAVTVQSYGDTVEVPSVGYIVVASPSSTESQRGLYKLDNSDLYTQREP